MSESMIGEVGARVAAMGDGPLTEDALREHVFPLFSRSLQREEIYLANHSLGRPLDRTAEDVRAALDRWYRDMDGAWEAWMEEIGRFRANTARLLGLSRPDAVVPKTSAGQGLRAVLNTFEKPPTVVATRGEFDSVDFILKTYASKGRATIRWVDADSRGLFHAEDIIGALKDADLVVFPHVFFVTGQVLEDAGAVAAAARRVGAITLLDTYHSAGVLPLDLEALGVDFAIGGSYKYLRGGPGACWLAVHPRHLEESPRPRLRTLDTGWFAKRDTFSYRRTDEPELSDGGDAWLESTPPVLTPYQAKAGLEFTLAVGPDRLRRYSLAQQTYFSDRLEGLGVPMRLIEPRGAFFLIPHDDAPGLSRALKAHGVNTDARGRYMRVCPDVLTTRDEIARAAQTIADVVRSA